jgi:hypothetical protein
MPAHKGFHLTARRDFGAYRRGDHIEDEAEVNRILKSELRHHVVKVPADVKPEPTPAPGFMATGPEPRQLEASDGFDAKK